MSHSHGEFLSKHLHLAQTSVRCCVSVLLSKCSSNRVSYSFGERVAAAGEGGRKKGGGGGGGGRGPAGGHEGPGLPQAYALRSL